MWHYIKYMVKIMVAGGIAFFILNALFFFVYNVGNYNLNANGEALATDFNYKSNSFRSTCIEGFAWGYYNENGYNSREADHYDAIALGCSHLDGFNVNTDENVIYLLEEKLSQEYRDFPIYNLGMSNHGMLHCVSNLKTAVELYNPEKYVILETPAILFDSEEINQTIEGKLQPVNPATHRGLAGTIVRAFPFLKKLNMQYNQLKVKANKPGEDKEDSESINESQDKYKESIVDLLKYSNDIVRENGCRLIIIYHIGLKIKEDGTAIVNITEEEKKALEIFRGVCQEMDITFIDMSDRFSDGYRTEHILPTGFSNTAVGAAHTNKYGHAMMAEALYEVILQLEEEY